MKTSIFNFIYILCLAACVQTSFGQTAPTLGTADGFALFTSVGEIANTGTTTVTGNIGYFNGSLTGDAITVVGTTHYGDPQSETVATDVANAYSQLTDNTLNACGATLLSPIGNGATLTPGVYCSTTATVLTGDLTLDGQGDPDAVFIIKIDGALSVNAPLNITLTGSASLENVYWQVNGALNLAAGVEFKGTVINVGAISLASGASISGRALSTAGKISLDNNNVSSAEVSLPVTLVSFVVKNGENETALLTWSTTAETNSGRFEIEHSVTGKTWNTIATITAKGESRELMMYSYHDITPSKGINLYRLKMVDQDETFAYSRIRNINLRSGSKAVLYPNPFFDKLDLQVTDISNVERIQFSDMNGKLILDQKRISTSNMQFDFNVNSFNSGLYLVRITNADGSVDVVKIIKK